MSRFQTEKKSHSSRRIVLSAVIFALILGLFLLGVSSFSDDTLDRQYESLENALNRDITYCYAVEGFYPESLDYIKEHYGLTYDEDHFYVDYHAIAANIPPDVTIIRREEQ